MGATSAIAALAMNVRWFIVDLLISVVDGVSASMELAADAAAMVLVFRHSIMVF
jgi:hypothetical protein